VKRDNFNARRSVAKILWCETAMAGGGAGVKRGSLPALLAQREVEQPLCF
jgi:hypothetical protein